MIEQEIDKKERASRTRQLSDNKSKKLKLPKLKKGSGKIISIILIIIMVAIIIKLVVSTISAGASALVDSYNTAYTASKDSAYQAQYDKYYDRAEKQYHVSNRVSITIGDLKETEKLEVLQVSDIEYIIEDGKNNNKNITSWLEVPGNGTYVVDLQAAEFIVDDERLYVLARVPYPELTNISIDYSNVKQLLFNNDILNDSIQVGEDLARQQLNSADLLIKKEFASNQNFYLTAQKNAVSTIQCLIKQLNPEVSDLTVDVEFY